MSRTTIIIDRNTRDNLKHIARKDQTYDQLINELIHSRYITNTGTEDHEINRKDSSASLEHTLESRNS